MGLCFFLQQYQLRAQSKALQREQYEPPISVVSHYCWCLGDAMAMLAVCTSEGAPQTGEWLVHLAVIQPFQAGQGSILEKGWSRGQDRQQPTQPPCRAAQPYTKALASAAAKYLAHKLGDPSPALYPYRGESWHFNLWSLPQLPRCCSHLATAELQGGHAMQVNLAWINERSSTFTLGFWTLYYSWSSLNS